MRQHGTRTVIAACAVLGLLCAGAGKAGAAGREPVPLLTSGDLTVSDRMLLMGVAAKRKQGAAGEELRAYARAQLERLRERLLFAAAALREEVAGEEFAASLESFRLEHLADLYVAERVQAAARAAALEKVKKANDPASEAFYARRERERLMEQVKAAARAAFPVTVDEKVLTAAVLARQADAVVASIGDRTVRFGDLRDELARVAHPSDPGGDAAVRVARTVLESILSRLQIALLAERENYGSRADFLDDLQDRRLRGLERLYLEKKVYPAAEVSEEQVRSRYEQERTKLARGPERELAEIVVREQADLDAILARLRAGADFSAEARAHSIGPTKERGGSLGFLPPGALRPEMERAVAALEPGGLSAPVKTVFGYHVLKCLSVVDGRIPPFEEVRALLGGQMHAERRAAARAQSAAGLEKIQVVRVNDAGLQEVLSTL